MLLEQQHLMSVISHLRDGDKAFAASLATAPNPSLKQLHWIGVLIERAKNAQQPAPQVQGAGLTKVKELLDRAAAKVKGERSPKIRLTDLHLSRAKDTSRNPGAVYVTDPKGTYLGKILPNGEVKLLSSAPQTALASIQAFAADPAAVGAAYGQNTGHCCFCGRLLKGNKGRSLAVGYGKDCAETYGLPWGDATVETEVVEG